MWIAASEIADIGTLLTGLAALAAAAAGFQGVRRKRDQPPDEDPPPSNDGRRLRVLVDELGATQDELAACVVERDMLRREVGR